MSKESVADEPESSSKVVKKTVDKNSKLKQFNLYTVTVTGPWSGNDSALCAEVFFPNGQRGMILIVFDFFIIN